MKKTITYIAVTALIVLFVAIFLMTSGNAELAGTLYSIFIFLIFTVVILGLIFFLRNSILNSKN